MITNLERAKYLDDSDKILFVIREAFNANSVETAVSMEQIIEKGIELGLTTDYFRDRWEGYKEGDHPWWPKISPMMGIGSASSVKEYEVQHLHRVKVQRKSESGRLCDTMVYYYDDTKIHEIVERNAKAGTRSPEPKVKRSVVETRKSYTRENAERIAAEHPDIFMVINGKLVSKNFIKDHPEKFDENIVAMANS